MAPDVAAAVYGTSTDIARGLEEVASIARRRSAVRASFPCPTTSIRYQIGARNNGRLEYRIGLWRQVWANGRITRFEPLEETITSAPHPWFRDVTGWMFADEPAFAQQLAFGVPYWRGRLDSAAGIDLYGENGISAADIDGDGEDEIYVCQTGRAAQPPLSSATDKGRYRDIAKAAGLDILDDTACALFVDLRNSGHQDLVLVRTVAARCCS